MARPESPDVLIVGAGPAGMVLGLLLAARGVRTLVLEQAANFGREYRGEVLMPRFTQMMRQIGLFEYLEGFPHLKLKDFELFVAGRLAARVDISRFAAEAPFIIWMPQPVMLDALARKARVYPAFRLLFDAEADALVRENGRVVGVEATVAGAKREIRAKLVVGADGRASIVLRRGGFELEKNEHEFDVLWFTIPKPPGLTNTVRGFLSPARNFLILPKYPNHIQCGLILEPGGYAAYRKAGIDALRRELVAAHPVFRDFAAGLADFKPFNLLPAHVHLARRWAQDGCLLVGDAAHTCSPAGAIGVSVAVGTAIVAADVVLKCLAKNDVSTAALGEVQRLREADVRMIQGLQKGFARVVGAHSPLAKTLAAAAVYLFGRTRVLAGVQRRLMVMDRPLPIAPDLRVR
jgi:2-polyprenyl-6-methoxyphenol hydroxylase-like FAD-dependent oxidoreductase